MPDNLAETQITLALQDKLYTGTARGPIGVRGNVEEDQLHQAVEATLAAILQALKRPIKFEITGIAVREMNEQKQRFIVVLLKTDYFIQPVGEAVELLGACQLTSSPADSAARATLNATNRTISLLLK